MEAKNGRCVVVFPQSTPKQMNDKNVPRVPIVEYGRVEGLDLSFPFLARGRPSRSIHKFVSQMFLSLQRAAPAGLHTIATPCRNSQANRIIGNNKRAVLLSEYIEAVLAGSKTYSHGLSVAELGFDVTRGQQVDPLFASDCAYTTCSSNPHVCDVLFGAEGTFTLEHVDGGHGGGVTIDVLEGLDEGKGGDGKDAGADEKKKKVLKWVSLRPPV